MTKVQHPKLRVGSAVDVRFLELVRGLDVPMFLLDIWRFVSCEGLPAAFISDNAKTFKSAARELQKIF